jgi:hypothetical protein
MEETSNVKDDNALSVVFARQRAITEQLKATFQSKDGQIDFKVLDLLTEEYKDLEFLKEKSSLSAILTMQREIAGDIATLVKMLEKYRISSITQILNYLTKESEQLENLAAAIIKTETL